jgi:hypothetical protein
VLIRPEDIVHDEASPLQTEILHLVLVSSHHDQAVGQHIGIRPNVGEIVRENQNSRITPHKQRSIPPARPLPGLFGRGLRWQTKSSTPGRRPEAGICLRPPALGDGRRHQRQRKPPPQGRLKNAL